MRASTVTFTALPRCAALTRVLLEPDVVRLSPEEVSSARRELEAELTTESRRFELRRPVRVDPYTVRRALLGQGDVAPFSWNPSTARRRIGIEAVRTCLERPQLTPLEATRAHVEDLLHTAPEHGAATAMATWMRGLAPGALAVVQAEAVLWATQLLAALDWSTPAVPLLGVDRTVSVGSPARAVLRSRVDVQLRAPGTGHQPTGVLVMFPGYPLPTAPVELGVAALCTVLASRPDKAPTSIAGFWPQCGRAIAVRVDRDLLTRAREAMVAVFRNEIRRPGHRVSAAPGPSIGTLADRVAS